jgi:hypothetical protein
MGNKPDHVEDDEWLKWCAYLSTWPEELQDLGTRYSGVTCYRLGHAHLWLQRYDFGGTYGMPKLFADGLCGADSQFPGGLITHIDVETLNPCSCGAYILPTKEQAAAAKQRYETQRAMRQKERLN